MELTARVIGAGTDEVCQHVIFIGRADQTAHGQPHALGIVTGKDVAEVAGRNAEVHWLAPGDSAVLCQTEVGIEVVNDLRNQPSPVDGVCAGKANTALFKRFRHRRIGKNFFHTGLGVVKVSVHRVNMDVFSLLGRHLQALDLTGAGIGVKDRNLNVLKPGIARQSRLAGITGSRHQNPGCLGTAQILFALEQQLGHQLKGVVLERAGGPVPQFQ